MLDQALSIAEKGLRRAGMYAYAFNQSRAKVVMDPLYSAVAASLLRKDLPLHPRLRSAKIPDNLFFAYRTSSRKLQYFVEDWDFSTARPDLLTPRQRQMMHTVALGETSGAAVSDGFLRAFRRDPELAAFFGVWFTEELNHFLGYHLYLDRMGERWPAQRGLDVASVEFIPYSEDTYELAAANMYQELLGFLVYRQLAKQVRDPFLSKMLHQFAKDELRHYKFYQQVTARRIQRDPSFRRTVLKVILKATSPYNQVSGGAGNVLDHLQLGAFYFRKAEYDFFLREVDYLLGTPLTSFFDWLFKDITDPCSHCRRAPYRCACESFEDDRPPAVNNPQWWRQTSAPAAQTVTDPGLDAWIKELRAHRPAA